MASFEPIRLVPMNSRVKKKLEIFKMVIAEKKSEVNRVKEYMKQLIEIQSENVLRELNTIWLEVNELIDSKREEIQKNIEVINTHKEAMEEIFFQFNQDSTPINEISEKIESMKKEMDIDIPFVRLNWEIEELRVSIRNMCSCKQQVVSFEQDRPTVLKWSCCNRGIGKYELGQPSGLTISPMDGRIYVADANIGRVQVFSSNGVWFGCIKDERMVLPENILIQNNSLYVQCDSCILKYNEFTFEDEDYISCLFPLRGICSDNNNVYVGMWDKLELISWTVDLKDERRISLENFEDFTTSIRDIAIAGEEFYILLSDIAVSLQAFSKEGFPTRFISISASLTDAYYFCLDQHLNIIVSDGGKDVIMIFSNEGELLIHYDHISTGTFSKLHGIAVDDMGSIITVDDKDENMLQAYSFP